MWQYITSAIKILVSINFIKSLKKKNNNPWDWMQRWPSPKQSLPVFKLWTPVTAIGHVQKQTQTVRFHAWEMVLAAVGRVVRRGDARAFEILILYSN